MSKIKSLAEQLKSKLEEEKLLSGKPAIPQKAESEGIKKGKRKLAVDTKQMSRLIESLQGYPMDGQEKILIRIDKSTMNYLRRIKLACNVDMTRVIVFSLHQFLKSYPWLNEYISQTLNNMTHELD